MPDEAGLAPVQMWVLDWASSVLGDSVAVFSARPQNEKVASTWVAIDAPEADFEVLYVGAGDRRWETTWEIPVYIGSGRVVRSPHEAVSNCLDHVGELLDGLADDPTLGQERIRVAMPTRLEVDEPWAAAGQVIYRLELSMRLLGW